MLFSGMEALSNYPCGLCLRQGHKGYDGGTLALCYVVARFPLSFVPSLFYLSIIAHAPPWLLCLTFEGVLGLLFCSFAVLSDINLQPHHFGGNSLYGWGKKKHAPTHL